VETDLTVGSISQDQTPWSELVPTPVSDRTKPIGSGGSGGSPVVVVGGGESRRQRPAHADVLTDEVTICWDLCWIPSLVFIFIFILFYFSLVILARQWIRILAHDIELY